MSKIKNNAIIIREISDDDFNTWLRLRCILWGYIEPKEHESSMLKIKNDIGKTAAVFLGCVDGEVAGFIEVFLRDTAIGCKTYGVGYIDGWYVEPLYRRTGVGGELVKAAERWAVSKGCAEMATETEERYPISPVAAKSLGYVEVAPNHFVKSMMSL